jgi:hypothetical protein
MKYEEWIETADIPSGATSTYRERVCYAAGQYDLLKQIKKLVNDHTRLDCIIPCLYNYLDTGDVYEKRTYDC